MAEVRSSRGDRARVDSLTLQALAIEPIDARSLVDIGIIARDEGFRDRALAIFDSVITDGRCRQMALYEKAILFLHEGNHKAAIASILKAVEAEPNDARANLLAAKLLFSVGDFERGKNCIDALDPANMPTEIHAEMRVIIQLGDFLRSFSRDYVLNKCYQYELSNRWLDVNQVAETAAAALRDERGYSLIRCGDGEGAFLRISNTDETKFSHLYEFNRQNRAQVWFDGTIDIQSSGFSNAAFTLKEAILNADVVGLPYTGWLEHEYRILSPTGISSLANLLRLPLNSVPNFCTQQIHLELHSTKQIYNLMRSVHTIGLISCHSQLPEMLKSKFGFLDVDYHYIPGEKGHRHLIPESSIIGEHWPDGYERVMASLRRPLAGKLYIVAAGILGKLYCNQIKMSGGVAIDMGSIADGWVGSPTRPGLVSLQLG